MPERPQAVVNSLSRTNLRLLELTNQSSILANSIHDPQQRDSVCSRVDQPLDMQDFKNDDPPTERLFSPDEFPSCGVKYPEEGGRNNDTTIVSDLS